MGGKSHRLSGAWCLQKGELVDIGLPLISNNITSKKAEKS